ncbi:MAG: hypothetical protein ACYTG6_02760 [Planctomycetota bacterium]
MDTQLDLERKRLIIGTNDQRRRFGQALYHFYRTLVFWMEKDLSFSEITKAWSAGGAAIFDSLASTLREIGPPQLDVRLRRFVSTVLVQLATDLDRGGHMTAPFLRWLEARFPELTSMMQEETADSRIYDYELAHALALLFSDLARAEPGELAAHLRRTAVELR